MCERERDYILCELLGVGLVSAGCCVHCRQPGKMLRLTSGTPHNVCTCVCVCVCVCVCEREIILCELLGVGLVSAGCCVHCRQPGKMLHLTSGTQHIVCVCVCEREREVIFCVSF